MIPRHQLGGDETGAALVEFSILLPILFAMVFGLIEFSRATYQHVVAEKGVKAAARYVARAPAPDPCDPGASAGYAAALTQAANLAQRGQVSGGTAALQNWTDPSAVSIGLTTVSNAAASGSRPWRGQCENLYIVTVSTSFPYDDIGLLGALRALTNSTAQGGLTIRASHQEVFVGD